MSPLEPVGAFLSSVQEDEGKDEPGRVTFRHATSKWAVTWALFFSFGFFSFE
jgi:hypothetical protein